MVFRHEKVPGGRSSALVHRMDLRNNLILVERYLPRPLRRAYRHDWVRRYSALARAAGHADAAKTGMYEAPVWRAASARWGGRRWTKPRSRRSSNFEGRPRRWRRGGARHGVNRVVISDFSKNLFATFRACRQPGLEIVAVADDREAFTGMRYRGVPVLKSADAFAGGGIDGVVVSNINPAQVDSLARQVRERFAGPVLTLWEPRHLEQPQDGPTTAAPKPIKPGARAA